MSPQNHYEHVPHYEAHSSTSVVTGHFMCLVHREGKQPRWAFDDGRAEYAAENKFAYKKALASALEELGPWPGGCANAFVVICVPS